LHLMRRWHLRRIIRFFILRQLWHQRVRSLRRLLRVQVREQGYLTTCMEVELSGLQHRPTLTIAHPLQDLPTWLCSYWNCQRLHCLPQGPVS
jgi:hypothetical protein